MRFVFLFFITLSLITSDVLASDARTPSAAAGHDEAAGGGEGRERLLAAIRTLLGPRASAGVLSPDQLAYAAAMLRKAEAEYNAQVARAGCVDFPRVLAAVPRAEDLLVRPRFYG